jgi:hypothetical protein
MITHFITTKVDLPASPAQLHEAIAAELKTRGTPLRWAITAVDLEQGSVYLEAVVTTEEDILPSVVVPITSV